MKQTPHVSRGLFAAVIGLMASLSTGTLLAQTPLPYTNIVVTSFDDFLSPADFSQDSGPSGTIFDWSDEDAGGGAPGSGSMLLSINWTPTDGGWQEAQFSMDDPIGGWPGRPLAPYYTIEMDVKVLSGDLGTDASYGDVQLIFQGWNGAGDNGTGSGWQTLGLQEVTSTDWQHFTWVLTGQAHMNLNKFVINFVGQNVTNQIDYVVDNITINLPTGPAPSLALEPPPAPGLHLVMGAQFARQNIRTVGTNYGWVGAGGPVTYSVTINDYPDGVTYSNFQTHLLFLPDATNGTASDPDWTEPNVARLDIQTTNGPGVAATAEFRYKTNAPGSNGIFYDDEAGLLALVESTTVLGTWTLTFTSDTAATITAPDGSSANFTFANAPAFFASDSFRVYYGGQASEEENSGQESIIGGATITGAAGPDISDNFTGSALDTSTWEIAANNADNVFQVPAGAGSSVSWPVPDNLYALYAAADLAAPDAWQDLGLDAALSEGVRSVVIPAGVPSEDQGYFQLAKIAPIKLQVLLPGEIAAPGTATGKTGAPINQAVNTPFEVVVNAVDDNWYPAFLSDEMYIASSAGGTNEFGFVFAEELIHGTYTYTVSNLTAGTWTITASDNTDSNIVENVSSSYTVE